MSPEADRGRTRPGYFIVRSCRASLSGFPVDILVQGALPARHEVGGVCPVTPGRHPRGIHVLGTTGKRLWQPGHALAKRMRLAEGHRARQRDSHEGEQDCDLRLLLSKLFRRCRLPKERADRSLRARQRDHSDAQSVALGTWQHANADNLKGSFACRCYGCTGAGRLFAGKSNPTAFTRVARRRTTGLFN